MYLSVDERICLEHVGMALVFVGCLALVQYVTEWCQIVEVPIRVHKPLCLDEWYILSVHSCCESSLQTLLVHLSYHFFVVLDVYLVHVAIVVVVAAVSRLALLPPHLDYSASCRVRCKQEVIVLQSAITETLTLGNKCTLASCQCVDAA